MKKILIFLILTILPFTTSLTFGNDDIIIEKQESQLQEIYKCVNISGFKDCVKQEGKTQVTDPDEYPSLSECIASGCKTTTVYQCPITGQVYANNSDCYNNCIQTATCVND